MLNHITLMGRLAQDPELKQTPTGTPVTSFDLAVPVPSKDKKTPPDYIPIVCWNKQAEFVTRYLAKGRQIVVEGRIKARRYVDGEGKNRKSVEVHASNIYFADSNPGKANNDSQTDPDDYDAANYEELPNDGDLPF